MDLNPSNELYFVNWDDYGKRHVVYRIRVEQERIYPNFGVTEFGFKIRTFTAIM